MTVVPLRQDSGRSVRANLSLEAKPSCSMPAMRQQGARAHAVGISREGRAGADRRRGIARQT